MRFNLVIEKEYDISFTYNYEVTFILTIYIYSSQDKEEITYI